MYKMSIKYIFSISMFDFTVGFHIVASRENLVTHGALMLLRAMNVRMMPSIRDGFMARDTAIQGGKCTGELDEKC